MAHHQQKHTFFVLSSLQYIHTTRRVQKSRATRKQTTTIITLWRVYEANNKTPTYSQPIVSVYRHSLARKVPSGKYNNTHQVPRAFL